MNIEETKKAIEVMQAYVDGKTIQYRSSAGWRDVNTLSNGYPSWLWSAVVYRIKPEPKEIWVNEYDDGTLGGCRASREEALRYSDQSRLSRTVRYREVIEE